ncbi:protein CUP-SHAPED COTYLEDON 1 [Brachypodium distachyon]|uniref:NAC domain-containing protein n=1 Tax=Brachypodium distachyon TaxID=15368 RepID=A0A0Q3FU07_BRADI|nr:protein CUP-SHAPED COTYLEDON 1 [Brachypodium distachyon]KQK02751.1 hypothetical protein BRADI_2g03448v3 [Brachypodium distachyon]|eukprot:XP_003565350.1 protein CUP-SHAPED COTYLEDON 1 [Brachypodium distachyon]
MGDMQQQHLQQGQLDLPPGFRFHPTDEELIVFYLNPKVSNRSFCTRAIGEVDMNKSEPWELPAKAKMTAGDDMKEWYFYCHRDRKYPTGHRTNRATQAGYWKATGKDKEIFRPQSVLIGMKKTLVFYKGRAPRGEKTNWVMHEYRMESNNNNNENKVLSFLPTAKVTNSSSLKDEWVVCRIFHKTTGIKKLVMPSYPMAPVAMGDQQQGLGSSTAACIQTQLPPPMAMGMDPSTLYGTTAGASSSYQLPPPMPMGNVAELPALPMNGLYFGAQLQAPPPPAPLSFYQQHMQLQMGHAGDQGFIASGPSSMVSQSQDDIAGVSNATATEISSMDMGGIAIDGMGMWKFQKY